MARHKITVEQLATIQKQSTKPLLTVFFAEWCGYCAQNVPQITAYLAKHHPQLEWYLVDVTDPKVPVWVEEHDKVWALELVPTTRIYVGTRKVFEHKNVINDKQLAAALQQHQLG